MYFRRHSQKTCSYTHLLVISHSHKGTVNKNSSAGPGKERRGLLSKLPHIMNFSSNFCKQRKWREMLMIKVVSKYCARQSSSVGFGGLGGTAKQENLFGKLHTILQLLASIRVLHLFSGYFQQCTTSCRAMKQYDEYLPQEVLNQIILVSKYLCWNIFKQQTTGSGYLIKSTCSEFWAVTI